MTHAELVKVAARWLRNNRRCGVVLTEHHGGTVEVPDAIGWRASYSVQVECKVSRADFKADAKKAGRRHDRLTGQYRQALERWYLTPAGLISSVRDLPDGWGLLEYAGRRVQVIVAAVPAVRADATAENEITRLYMELRRYQSQGIRYKTVTELQAEEARRLAERREARLREVSA